MKRECPVILKPKSPSLKPKSVKKVSLKSTKSGKVVTSKKKK